MHRAVFILPDGEKRLPNAKELRRAGFMVSTAMDANAETKKGKQGKASPWEERPRRTGTDGS